MKHVTLNDGAHLPALGFGTWEMGGRMEKDDSQDERFIRAVKTAVEVGFTHIDTAEMYGNGHTETIVARAIEDVQRDRLFITSKVRKENLAYADVHKACDGSLERLGTDFLDLYLVHHPNPDIPVKETFKALDELVDNGKIRRYGVSNFNVKQMEEVRQFAKRPIMANQIEYNLQTRNSGVFNRDMEKEIIPYCLKNNMLVIAWRPLVKGELNREIEILKKLSEKYRCTPNQLAIAWLINKPLHATIAKATSEDHIRENFAAADIELEANDMKLLDRLSH